MVFIISKNILIHKAPDSSALPNTTQTRNNLVRPYNAQVLN